MTTPYGQRPPGQQPPGDQPSPFGQPPQSSHGDQSSPFGQQVSGEQQSSPFGQQPPAPQQSPFGQPFGAQQQQSPFGQQPQSSPFGQPQHGQPSPFGQQSGRQAPFGQATPFDPRQVHAHWGLRAGAALIDFGPIVVLPIIGSIISATGSYTVGMIIAGLGYLAGLGWTIYNRWMQMGTTGQSLGKKVLKIKLVREADGQPIGPLMAFVRDLCHNLDGWVCGLGYLWPLWDQKKQTFADKILSTVVVPAAAAAPASEPFGQPSGFPAPPSPFGQPQQQQQQPFGAPQQPSPFGQPPRQPQQSQPFGQQPQGTSAPSSESQTESGFGEAEPTQVLRPGQPSQQAPSGFDEAEPTQKITPEQLRQQLPGADGPNGPGTPQQ
ncbi:hypothetical protein BS329_33820 [Amycolatopsis coloradensis]|uniref:RDD domain-containing protein n=1 Tax=Amycolatopsis coloradensis TaxID=76021 RepID=A0A1R0KI31_9PSEU|nr:RDD family protein [Amycolatopsis coloradensis]OLZ45407.1 hypothetical protein BS329_33820 [Amycolatopsis coloradensis]